MTSSVTDSTFPATGCCYFYWALYFTIYSNVLLSICVGYINEQDLSIVHRRFLSSYFSHNSTGNLNEQQTACMTTCIDAHKNVTEKCCIHNDCVSLPVADLIQHIGNCSVDGMWLRWAQWSHCSSTCAGTRYRQRQCHYPPYLPQGQFCRGHGIESEPCGTQSC